MKPDRIKLNQIKLDINSLNNLIKEKQNELNIKLKKKSEETTELNELNKSSTTTRTIRDQTKKEIDGIKIELTNKRQELLKLKADLRYKTVEEYEDMIDRLENDMRCNKKTYNAHEERRGLDEIQSMKNGIKKLEEYQSKNQILNELNDKLKLRNQAYTDNKTNYSLINVKQKKLQENYPKIRSEIHKIVSDINLFAKKKDELNKRYTKEKQDYNAQIKHLKQKRTKENAQYQSQSKFNDEIYKLENESKNCSKLISFLQPFQQQQQTVDFTDPLDNSMSEISSSSDLNASSSSSTTQNANSTSSNNSANNLNEERGLYLCKKKTDDDLVENRNKTKRHSKLKKTKSLKLSYTLQELNLFKELNIEEPKSLTQIDECIKLLKEKKDLLLNEIKNLELRKQETEASFVNAISNEELEFLEDDDSEFILNNDLLAHTSEQLLAACLSPTEKSNFHLLNSDTNSEISNLDLNYQSDDCYQNVAAYNQLLNVNKSKDELVQSINVSDDSDNTTTAEPITDKSLLALIVDDDDDNETSKQLNETAAKSGNEYNNEQLLNSSSILSSSITAALPTAVNNQISIAPPPVIINRQFSDGYGSSCSQLSAGSSEQNPFFTEN